MGEIWRNGMWKQSYPRIQPQVLVQVVTLYWFRSGSTSHTDHFIHKETYVRISNEICIHAIVAEIYASDVAIVYPEQVQKRVLSRVKDLLRLSCFLHQKLWIWVSVWSSTLKRVTSGSGDAITWLRGRHSDGSWVITGQSKNTAFHIIWSLSNVVLRT